MQPRTLVIHRSLNRPALLLGCDRELILFSGLIAAVMIFSVMSKLSILFGILFWMACLAGLSRMGKVDPLMRQVFIRHIRYKDFAPASARYCGVAPMVADGWKE
jgi:type IV secretion system protein VirB3